MGGLLAPGASRKLLLALLAHLLAQSAALARAQGPEQVGNVLVWAETSRGPVTFELDPTRAYRAVAERPGIRVAVDRGVVALRFGEEQGEAFRCDWQRIDLVRDGTRMVTGTRLEEVDPDGRVRVLLASRELDTMQEYDDRMRVVATIGPYLAVTRSLAYYAPCSAHGEHRINHFWFDLRDGTQVRLREEVPLDADAREDAEQELDGQYGRSVNGSGVSAAERRELLSARDYHPRYIRGIEPVLSMTRWVARYHVAMGVPYVYSGSASYEISVAVEEQDLGPRFDGYKHVPPEVARFLRRRGLRLGGFSWVRP